MIGIVLCHRCVGFHSEEEACAVGAVERAWQCVKDHWCQLKK